MRLLVWRLAVAVEIAHAYLVARRLMDGGDLPTTLRALRRRTAGAAVPEMAPLVRSARLGGAVARTLGFMRADDRCLMRSLVLSRMLDRRGIPSRVVIGVRPGETFGAHAWVEVAGRPVLEPGGSTFPRLVAL